MHVNKEMMEAIVEHMDIVSPSVGDFKDALQGDFASKMIREYVSETCFLDGTTLHGNMFENMLEDVESELIYYFEESIPCYNEDQFDR